MEETTHSNEIRIIIPKQSLKRVITQTTSWNFTESDLQPEKQIEYIGHLDNSCIINTKNEVRREDSLRDAPKESITSSPPITEINIFVKKNILQKISSYKAQDIKKNKYNCEKFITYNEVINKLHECSIKCFYCDKNVLLLYENVRDPRQWSLERIDNKYGHNNDNIEISCLNCNLKRKTMYHERYLMTKKLVIIRKQ